MLFHRARPPVIKMDRIGRLLQQLSQSTTSTSATAAANTVALSALPPPWDCPLELAEGQRLVSGSEAELAAAVAAGADVKIREEFLHSEHVDRAEQQFDDLIVEVAQMGVTMLIDRPATAAEPATRFVCAVTRGCATSIGAPLLLRPFATIPTTWNEV